MATLLSDNTYATLGSGLTVSATTLNFTAGMGARFPAVTAPDVLYCCILNSSNVLEEIIITAHTAGADSATITRAAGGTTAQAWNTGDRVEARLSSTVLTNFVKWYSFDSGTRMSFQQTSAPNGWTKDTTVTNDAAMRLVTGTTTFGGSNGLSTLTPAGAIGGSVDGHAITVNEMPSHAHQQQITTSTVAVGPPTPAYYAASGGSPQNFISAVASTANITTTLTPLLTLSTGSGVMHSHTVTGVTFTGTAASVKYYDFIVCSKV